MKMDFYSEIKSFVNENYDGNISTNRILNDVYEHIFIVEKKIVLLFVPIYANDFDSSQRMFFQNLATAAEKQNLQLVIIHEDKWITKKDVIRCRLLAHLGKFVRIHGRLCDTKRITKAQADEFLFQNHLYDSPQAKHKYGLFYKNQLVAVATFSGGRPIVRDKKTYRSHELVRFANYRNYVVCGGMGKLVAHFIAEQNPDDIMSYADVDWSSGKSYEKLGFKFIEYTEPQKFYVDAKTSQRYYVKKNLHEAVDKLARRALPLDDFLSEHDIFTIYNSGNKKYLLKLK
ncbi:MAG: hypothetical protein LBE11_04415 [Prevotellaceae bacterium]|jgi:hypothetical protein|nr:hypothetical protein [Prevotellaceae bacterium]